MTSLNVYKAWEKAKQSQVWCQKHFINHKALLRAQDIQKQLTARLWKLGISMSSCGANFDPILQSIACGYCMNAAKFERMDLSKLSAEVNVYKLIRVIGAENEVKLRIHGSSILSRCPPGYLVFHSVEQDDSGYYNMRDVTKIDPKWLIELAPHFYKSATEQSGRE